MDLSNQSTIKDIISESLEKSISYQNYRALVAHLVKIEATTGEAQTEALIDYTMLNDRRMKRWDKTIKVSDGVKQRIEAIDNNQTWLVLTESWCGDAAHIMPAINKLAELNDAIDYKVVMRDENEALMNAFLTNGGKSIPKLILIDNASGEVIDAFGPRPSEATKMVNEYKVAHGVLTPEFKEELQRWYNKDKGQGAMKDILDLINNQD